MDNSNNPTDPNNPIASSWPPANPQTTPTTPAASPVTEALPSVQPDISFPSSPWAPPQSNPTPSNTTPTPTYQSATPQPQPVNTNPVSNSTWNPTPEVPVTDNPLATPSTAHSIPSSLDNPWGAPSQPPPLGGLQQTSPIQPEAIEPLPNPVQTPPPAQPNQPSWMASSTPAPSSNESAPTDLSQLIASQPPETTPLSTPETLQVSQSNTVPPEVPTLPVEHKDIPKWLIGVGIGLLILVLGASAYFILGIGQQKTTTSLPVVTQPTTVKTPPPIASPVLQPTPPAEATGSSSFEQLGGSSGTQQATSAADLIRQRQQQGR